VKLASICEIGQKARRPPTVETTTAWTVSPTFHLAAMVPTSGRRFQVFAGQEVDDSRIRHLLNTSHTASGGEYVG
jgi:hypothetical protein